MKKIVFWSVTVVFGLVLSLLMGGESVIFYQSLTEPNSFWSRVFVFLCWTASSVVYIRFLKRAFDGPPADTGTED